MTAYDTRFYDSLADGSASSAAIVVPIMQKILGDPKSVLDAGCGIGTWLRVWIDAGVGDVVGVDGDYVDRNLLRIPDSKFCAVNLTEGFDAGRRFDLVLSLEVAEHIPAQHVAEYVSSLVKHGDLVAFSAAIPGQGGTAHVNEQWPTYWVEQFRVHGYYPIDVLRPLLWDLPQVDVWYRQNMLLFAKKDAASRLNLDIVDSSLNVVHPELYSAIMGRPLIAELKCRLRRSKLGPTLIDLKRRVYGRRS